MRTPMPRPLLLIFSVLAILSSPPTLQSQVPYMGAGLRLGYVLGEGVSLGAEVTFGMVLFIDPILTSSIAFGVQRNPTAPRRLTYRSWSAAMNITGIQFMGIGWGKTFYSLDGINYSGTRRILWGGPIFILVSLESYQFPNLDTQKKEIGLWGRIGVPLCCIS